MVFQELRVVCGPFVGVHACAGVTEREMVVRRQEKKHCLIEKHFLLLCGEHPQHTLGVVRTKPTDTIQTIA